MPGTVEYEDNTVNTNDLESGDDLQDENPNESSRDEDDGNIKAREVPSDDDDEDVYVEKTNDGFREGKDADESRKKTVQVVQQGGNAAGSTGGSTEPVKTVKSEPKVEPPVKTAEPAKTGDALTKAFNNESFRKRSEEEKLGRKTLARMQGNYDQAEQLAGALLQSIENLREVINNGQVFTSKLETLRGETRKGIDGAIEANQAMEATANQIKEFFSKDYQEMLNDTNRRIMSSYITQSRDGYLHLFQLAVKNFKQFTESAMKWHQKMESETGKELKDAADGTKKLLKLVYGLIALQVVTLALVGVLFAMK